MASESILQGIMNPPGTDFPERLSNLQTARSARTAQNLQNAEVQVDLMGRAAQTMLDSYYPEGSEQPTNPTQAARDYFRFRKQLIGAGVPSNALPERVPTGSQLKQVSDMALSVKERRATPEPEQFTLGPGETRFQTGPEGTQPIAEGGPGEPKPNTISAMGGTEKARRIEEIFGVTIPEGEWSEVKYVQDAEGKIRVTDQNRLGAEAPPGEQLTPHQGAKMAARESELESLQETREVARNTRQTTSELEDIIIQPDFEAGRIQPALTSLQGWAESFGVNLESFASGLGVNIGELSSKEEFDRLTKQLATSQFRKFKGNLNEKEVNIATGSVNDLGKSKDANIKALASLHAASILAEQTSTNLLRADTEAEYERIQDGISERGLDEFKALRDEIESRIKKRIDESPATFEGEPSEVPAGVKEAVPEGHTLGNQTGDGRWEVIDQNGNVVGHIVP